MFSGGLDEGLGFRVSGLVSGLGFISRLGTSTFGHLGAHVLVRVLDDC
jgi:hypothetical protein